MLATVSNMDMLFLRIRRVAQSGRSLLSAYRLILAVYCIADEDCSLWKRLKRWEATKV